MPKVEFKRVQTDEEVENIDIKDGQLIYTGTGKTFMDYGNERIPTGSGGGSVDVDTEMSDTSENAVQNKVIKEYVDDQVSSIPEEVIISNSEPTSTGNKIWIDTGEVGSAVSEITNEYSTSIGLGYSANYVNNITNNDYVDISSEITSINQPADLSVYRANYKKNSNINVLDMLLRSNTGFASGGSAAYILTLPENYRPTREIITTCRLTAEKRLDALKTFYDAIDNLHKLFYNPNLKALKNIAENHGDING